MSIEKKAVSVAEMARLVGLSRARFYQLVGTAFPHPQYSVATRRPFYPPELQQVCLEVRQRNQGVDGKPILFHRRAKDAKPSIPKPSRKKAPPDDSRHKDMLAGLKSLGMVGVTAAEVEGALKELHVSGLDNKDQGAVLRAVFLCLKRRDTSSPAPTTKGEATRTSLRRFMPLPRGWKPSC